MSTVHVGHGGTQIYCPDCRSVQVCKAIPATEVGKTSGQRWIRQDHQDVQWFRCGRRCPVGHKFLTVEIDEGFLDELVALRNALANIKADAEQYVRESTAASQSLDRLTRSLNLLRALKDYQQTNILPDDPLSTLGLSVRATSCLESANITTIRDLINRTATELLGLRNFGDTTLQEVLHKLAEVGFRLRHE
jgi:hypothetical protein